MRKIAFIYFNLFAVVYAGAQSFTFDPNNQDIGYTPRAFTFNNQEEIIISGEMQYYRVDPAEWEDRLVKMKGALVNTVSSYIPWGLHEPQKGEFDYQGYKDVFLFNRMADSLGLYSILKPSGYICNEFTGGGFPAWLWVEVGWPRTADPAFLAAIDNWLENIIPQLNPHQITEGGNMIFCQLENEYSKGNKPYLLHYRDKVRQLGMSIPLVNNGGKDLGHSGTIPTYDLYLKPAPESLLNRDWSRSNSRPADGKPRFSSEYESGWLNAEYSNMETQMGHISDEWLKTLAALAYYQGDAGLNYYMFCGGTDRGMNASKKFPNSYFNVAPIGEYGQLNDSYYRYKELHAFVRSFEDVFLHGKGEEIKLADVPENLMAKKLSYQGTELYFLVNASEEEKSFIFRPETRVTQSHRVTIPPLGIKLLAHHFSMDDDLTVINTSSDILFKSDTKLLLFGEVNQEGFIRLAGDQRDQINNNPFQMDVSYNNGFTKVRYMHRQEDQYIQIGNNQLWIVSMARAERTFFALEEGEVQGYLISDFYFADVTLDEDSIAVHYQATEGETSQQTYVPLDGTAFRQFDIQRPNPPEIIRQRISDLTSGELSFATIKQSDAFEEVNWGTPYEEAGLYNSGYALYTGTFDATRDTLSLLIPEINDYFAIYCNGQLIEKGQRTAQVHLSDLKRKDNLLEVFVLAGGLDKNGPGAVMSLSGTNLPFYLNPTHTISMEQWERKTLFRDSQEKNEFYRDKDVLLSYRDPDYSARIGMDIMELTGTPNAWETVDFSNDTLLQKFDGNVDWTRMSEMIDKTEVRVGEELAGKKVLLKINDADVWYSVYVNGQHFQGGWQGWDRWGFEDRPRYIDVTSAIQFGKKNSVVVRCWQGPKGGGLQEAADLVFCDDVLNGSAKLYRVNRVIESLIQSDNVDTDNIDPAKPAILSGSFNHQPRPGLQAPLYLELSGSIEVSGIFLNGTLVAKHFPYGYSDKIRLLPGDLKAGENQLSIVGFFAENQLPDLVVKSHMTHEKGKYTFPVPALP
ncbi:beta-galactosidase [Tunicatimonas pelagia]|uniref:beta-galactosidase n=1 Tax=Tunicatimonas pelagia TaxID=931531 RepID=UPI0026660C6D|nr:beta-galactosidase [Tunicatimonas pelagia]WKN45460.1 beta-galactosidase [Tunicatimonas pelagia]